MDFSYSYLRTEASVEVDLILERPGESDLLVEIKSGPKISSEDTRLLSTVAKDWDRRAAAQIWSQGKKAKTLDGVECLPWTEGLKPLFDV